MLLSLSVPVKSRHAACFGNGIVSVNGPCSASSSAASNGVTSGTIDLMPLASMPMRIGCLPRCTRCKEQRLPSCSDSSKPHLALSGAVRGRRVQPAPDAPQRHHAQAEHDGRAGHEPHDHALSRRRLRKRRRRIFQLSLFLRVRPGQRILRRISPGTNWGNNRPMKIAMAAIVIQVGQAFHRAFAVSVALPCDMSLNQRDRCAISAVTGLHFEYRQAIG